VQIAERWTVARLRHETFHSLEALNERVAELLAELRMFRLDRMRRARVLEEDRFRPDLEAVHRE
jgi:hypothetical protein